MSYGVHPQTDVPKAGTRSVGKFARELLTLRSKMKKDTGIKIGYDAKRAFNNMTGLGNYSRLVAGTMAGMYPANTYVLYTPRERENPRLEQLLMRENVEVKVPGGLWSRLAAAWRSAVICGDLATDNIDLYHGLSNEIPLAPMPCASVVTIHDLIWRRIPGDYSAIDRRLYDLKYGHAARKADRIIAISERTKADIVADWKVDPARIDVIYQGIDPAFGRPVTYDERKRVRDTYGLHGRYILTVGTVQSRKNQLLAVRAMDGLPQDVTLVIAGRPDRRYGPEVRAEIERLRLSDRVRWLESVPFADLPSLYAAAELSSYTSRYEGFGLPVVESLTVGTPVVACTGSCLEEAGGPGGVYVDPDDVRGYIEAARNILYKAYVRDRMAEAGRRYVRRFNPKDFASALMATYNKTILDYSLKNIK